jgi:hypothetical protein
VIVDQALQGHFFGGNARRIELNFDVDADFIRQRVSTIHGDEKGAGPRRSPVYLAVPPVAPFPDCARNNKWP